MQDFMQRAATAAFIGTLICGGLAALAWQPAAAAAQESRKEQDRPEKSVDKSREVTQEFEAANGKTGKTGGDIDLTALDRIGETCWADLRTKRVYFAHEVLGAEIATGIETVLARKPELGLTVISYRREEREARQRERQRDRQGVRQATSIDRPGIFQSGIGHNGEPEDKIDAFQEFLLSPEGSTIDVAVLKLSCSDIGRSTDVVRVLDRYTQAVDAIRAARPNLLVVHCTAPLREPDHGAKLAIKKMVGTGPDAANANRGRYNELLRKHFAGELIFDVARVQSRRLDGTEETVIVRNERWPALASEFGSGGHELTDAGRIVLGREFLLTLSHCCAEARTKATAAKSTATAAPTGDASSDE
jgi:hypothetical protein